MLFQKTTNYIKSFSAILKQLWVILSLFLHHPHLLLYPVLLKILKLQKEGNSRSLILKSKKACFSPADKFISPVEPTNIHDVQIGEEVLRETADKVGEAQVLSYGDENLEAKLFPHLFLYGKGSWYWKKMLLLLENITKCVLCK